jgi:hypothetical protein
LDTRVFGGQLGPQWGGAIWLARYRKRLQPPA